MDDKLEERLRDAVVMEHSGLIGERDKLDETSLGSEAADEITRLNAENERLRLHCANYEATMRVIGESSESAELARLNALVDEMREGLEPFAQAARNFLFAIGPDGIDDGLTVVAKTVARPEYEATLCTSHFSRAAALLAPVSHDQ